MSNLREALRLLPLHGIEVRRAAGPDKLPGLPFLSGYKPCPSCSCTCLCQYVCKNFWCQLTDPCRAPLQAQTSSCKLTWLTRTQCLPDTAASPSQGNCRPLTHLTLRS